MLTPKTLKIASDVALLAVNAILLFAILEYGIFG